MDEFRVGDRVRILDNGEAHHLQHYVPIGAVVEIKEVDDESVVVENPGKSDQFVSLASIELVERVVDPRDDDGAVYEPSPTGGVKGKKPGQLGAIDPESLLALARVAGGGTEKYDRYNFLKGYDWSLSFDAMQRHVLAFWAGEDLDPESGEQHMAHVAWHALALVAFAQRGIGTDDRFKGPE